MVKKSVKYILLFVALCGTTLLLLKLPELYFRREDKRLLTESGQSVYELKTVSQDMILFSEKLELFINSKEYMLNKEIVLQGEKLIAAEKRVAEEINALLSGSYAPVTQALAEGEANSLGFSVGVIYTEKDKTYTWDIGVLSFETSSPHRGGSAIYDMDTGKIFLLNMQMFDETDGEIAEMLSSKEFWEKDYRLSAEEYYEDIYIPWKEAAFEVGHYVYIAPMSWMEIEDSALVYELAVLCDKLFLCKEEVPMYIEQN